MRFAMVRWWGAGFLCAALLAVLSCMAVAQDDPVSEAPEQTVAGEVPAEEPLVEETEQTAPEPAEDSTADAAVGESPQPTPAHRPEPVQPIADTGSGEAIQQRLRIKTTPAETPAETQPSPEEPAADAEPLTPIPDALETEVVAVKTASFNGVTPGVTTAEQVEGAWNAPREIRKQGKAFVHWYSVAPFDRVEVSFIDEKVTAVVIRLEQAFPADKVAEQLQLDRVQPVLVSNALGEILGQSYPERGVLFAFEPSGEPGKASMRVSQIILEPVSAEPFVLRAETLLDSNPQQSLRDVDNALKFQPNNARAHWLRSRLLFAREEYDEALQACSRAVQFDAVNARYRVTRAQVLSELRRPGEALLEARKAAEMSRQRPHVMARALCLAGDLIASGAKPNHNAAMQYHMQAVKAADPLAASPHPAVRLAAKEVLVDAHLGAAHDIAWGSWKEKPQAVGKWLERARQFAEDLVVSEGRSEELRFRVAVRSLGACVGVRGGVDPTPWTGRVLQSGRQLIDAEDDAQRKAQLQWDLGMALYDALQVYQMRGEHETALKRGEQAVEYLEAGGRQKQIAAADYLRGRLYFRLGAIYAIRDENHQAAISWFDKAEPLLKRPVPEEAFADLGRHGETFVSMAVSYWSTGQREKAVELTERGAKLMEQAVRKGSLDKEALAVPYQNLASMHRQLGAAEKADTFEELAGKLKGTKLK